MHAVLTVREHESLEVGPSLTRQDVADLEAVAWKVLKRRDGNLAASNHVGIVTTRRGLVVEILPKIDLGGDADPAYEKTRQTFLRMLRCWQGFGEVLRESDIRSMPRFPMLEVFVHQFLVNLNMLVRAGLARRYISVEENLPYMRGKLLFREQLRENLTDRARFFVAHDELSINRPANRLIHSSLGKLTPVIRSDANRQLLRQLAEVFSSVPPATDPRADWEKHHVDRSMHHYAPVMKWVGLFLFNKGLTTFAGRHENLSLLFPMEKVFEDFVTQSFRRYQQRYEVTAHHPQKRLATKDGKEAFTTKPDIVLVDRGRFVFILDAKWKDVETHSRDLRNGIDQADMYQLYAYGKRYGCDAVALIYPRGAGFTSELSYRFFDGLPLVCVPFDVTEPGESVRQSLRALGGKASIR